MLRIISKFVHKFSKLTNSKFSCKITGKRINRNAGYGIEVPVKDKIDQIKNQRKL